MHLSLRYFVGPVTGYSTVNPFSFMLKGEVLNYIKDQSRSRKTTHLLQYGLYSQTVLRYLKRRTFQPKKLYLTSRTDTHYYDVNPSDSFRRHPWLRSESPHLQGRRTLSPPLEQLRYRGQRPWRSCLPCSPLEFTRAVCLPPTPSTLRNILTSHDVVGVVGPSVLRRLRRQDQINCSTLRKKKKCEKRSTF